MTSQNQEEKGDPMERYSKAHFEIRRLEKKLQDAKREKAQAWKAWQGEYEEDEEREDST